MTLFFNRPEIQHRTPSNAATRAIDAPSGEPLTTLWKWMLPMLSYCIDAITKARRSYFTLATIASAVSLLAIASNAFADKYVNNSMTKDQINAAIGSANGAEHEVVYFDAPDVETIYQLPQEIGGNYIVNNLGIRPKISEAR